MNDMPTNPEPADKSTAKSGWVERALNFIEVVGNRLPDPAVLFLALMVIIWVLSWLLSGVSFETVHPATGEAIQVTNLLSGDTFASFLSNMVTTFTGFAPLGVVLVAMLGVGVAEHSGFINAVLKKLLAVTPQMLLTPMLILVAIVSHTAVDAGYVLVIPLGGVIFYAAGRHPLAGIAAAFAGVSGGFSANFVPSAIDPLLQGFTQTAAQIVDPQIQVNPLNNWFFTSASCLLVTLLGWWLTDKVVEPRLKKVAIDGDEEDMPVMHGLGGREKKALYLALVVMAAGIVTLVAWMLPETSAMRDAQGQLASFSAPAMKSIVPLIFLLFVIPGVVFGYMAGTFKTSKDVIDAMSKTMSSMAYYIVMVFFCALFISEFARSGLGTLLSVEGGNLLAAMNLPGPVTIMGIILLVAFVNLFVGSASAKWALLAPIFVPMLMQIGFSPDLTQAAYRVGDSSTNIITPLMPYFPLVVVYCQRYVKSTGIGTLVSMMLPYSLVFLLCWSVFLVIYWSLGIPLGLQASYSYP
ncbi:AbgT family transporter [Microbulbifer thermotolerans]|uniref:AbgT family transporter n=1 Tax=Microbulbifer thermotolerans TaxID=252514 RepID=A0AB35HU22_MICTH|nr:AbgT family transporter [Microbulbifer thermotolerans]MCX2778729.1 AbgT family transporter [Microbulbifer thermotolerans]MCX2784409.1 AbgT family transporter [Microbulbifer thermotolerans]MCX2800799.1 AbgT family transporter [Microbulbifer thermotolerans]MCX2804034.1 AbgT family transporter [Microbulbifer thermotolerans]MCX2841052.1 AbgT family transporter [Microbulbifer thermotolerans]